MCPLIERVLYRRFHCIHDFCTCSHMACTHMACTTQSDCYTETWTTHTERSQVGGDHSVGGVLRLDDVGAVQDAMGVGVGEAACTRVVQEEGVAPQQRPHYLIRGKTCKEEKNIHKNITLYIYINNVDFTLPR